MLVSAFAVMMFVNHNRFVFIGCGRRATSISDCKGNNKVLQLGCKVALVRFFATELQMR